MCINCIVIPSGICYATRGSSFVCCSNLSFFISVAALEEFKDTADGLDSETLSASLGVPKEIIDTLGISDLASIFTNPPPGIDELVALTKIFQYADEKGIDIENQTL
jgi:hypothetical protein